MRSACRRGHYRVSEAGRGAVLRGEPVRERGTRPVRERGKLGCGWHSRQSGETSMRISIRGVALAATALAMTAVPGFCQDAKPKSAPAASAFPEGKPVEMVTLFGAASASTATARVLADGMAKVLGVPVPIVDKPGAGGATGYVYLSTQKPDGHSVVWSSNSISTSPWIPSERPSWSGNSSWAWWAVPASTTSTCADGAGRRGWSRVDPPREAGSATCRAPPELRASPWGETETRRSPG